MIDGRFSSVPKDQSPYSQEFKTNWGGVVEYSGIFNVYNLYSVR